MTENLRDLALEAMTTSRARTDPDYPLFHVAPPVGRLNDPNGLIVRNGTYHAFYQFSPFHPYRKLVYWGHATSTDLTRWQHREPAIVPDSWYDRNGAYSGNAISHQGTVHLFYTGNVRPSEDERDTHQCVVTSTDMATFTKSPANPLIPTPPPGYTQHVRDPQVWRDDDGTFRMCVGAQRSDLTGCALLYRSSDLLSWNFEGELQFPDASELFTRFGYMWECPSLVRVPDVSGEVMYDVLLFCPQGITPQREGFLNIFPTCYVIGRLEGNELRETGDFHELDRGFEFYAPQMFARDPEDDGPSLITAWVGNASEDDQPSIEHGWVHTLSVIRELRVQDGRLIQRPQLDVSTAQHITTGLPNHLPATGTEVPALSGCTSFAVKFTVEHPLQRGTGTEDQDASPTWGFRIGSAESHVDFRFTPEHMVVDRSTTRYAHGNRRTVTLPPARTDHDFPGDTTAQRSSLTVEVLHDRSITEVFLDDGALSFTMRSYLATEHPTFELRASQDMNLTWLSAAHFAPAPDEVLEQAD